jgi:predicted nucleic acid-binding protein
LILVDSSVWIDFLSSSPGWAGRELQRLIAGDEPVAITGIVVSEVLQGLTRGVDRIEHFLSTRPLLEPQGFETYRTAAALFRLARSRGVTVTTVDAVIAAIALENDLAVFSADHDFQYLAGLTHLRLHAPRS